MTADVLRTFWTFDPFHCVLVDDGKRYALQIRVRGQALLTESVETISEAQKRAKALFAVLIPTKPSR